MKVIGRPLRDTCKRGHPLTGDNVRVRAKLVKGSRYVERECLTCKALRSKATAAELDRAFGLTE